MGKMEAIKQIVRIPKNHELKIKVPKHIPANEVAEIFLLIKGKKQTLFKARINELKKSKSDKLFLEDMKNNLDDFKVVDAEGLA